ncbi:cation transporter [Proteus mirabilis]|uniref:Cation transporter n=1 Tax=Proteus mirabilis TaxID=584 RepID=A0A2X2DGN5_PROMI|nr:cation transporter [Proteus mirabilis]
MAIRREGSALPGKIVDEPLRLGDVLLVIGDWKLIRILSTKPRNFIVLNLAAEIDTVAPASSQAPHALFSLALMVALMVTNEVPNFIAAFNCLLIDGKISLYRYGKCLSFYSLAKYYLDCRDDAFCGCIAKNWGYRAYR